MIFPVKSIGLTANIQNTLVWSGADFQKSFGYAQPEKPISMTFSVENTTAQVCYVAISYQTRDVTYAIKDRRSIAGIPAQSTLRISSDLAAELASLGPNLVNVTLYLISAAGGVVNVTGEVFERAISPGSVGGGSQSIGLDNRSVNDYITIILDLPSVSIAPASGLVANYIVPAGKRAEIVYFMVAMDATPPGYEECFATISCAAILLKVSVGSEPFNNVQRVMEHLATIEENDTLTLSVLNTNPTQTRFIRTQVFIHEFFS